MRNALRVRRSSWPRATTPAWVTYVTHGRTSEGLLYLALEWLEGEDLGQRLRRKALTVEESLVLTRTAAEALAALHRHDIIHRDLKPSNLFLRDGLVEQVTLIDFGVARGGMSSWSVTRTGQLVGTLQYIAPEQARGDAKLTPSADVYALGCVLYECLTGAPPFAGNNLAAVLVRILLEEVPPLRRLRPELPAAFDRLLSRMLSRDPEARLADGDALLEALGCLDLPAQLGGLAPGPRPHPERLVEQKLVNIVLALPCPAAEQDTLRIEFAGNGQIVEVRRAALERALTPFGARVDHLAGGTVLVSLSQPGFAATDQAMQAARVALLVHEHMPDMVVALTTGQGVLADHGPTGGALERASQLIIEMGDLGLQAAGGSMPVLLDKLTAALIDARFDVRRVADGVFVLEKERVGTDEVRRLLGRPTPFVGREQELQLLEMVLASCLEEPSSQALVVLGAPGVGKSRLRHELLQRMEARSERIQVMIGRGDPMRAGAAYGMLVDALSRLCGFGAGMEMRHRRAQFAARVAGAESLVPVNERRQVVEFLGELCGLAFPDDESPQLKAARQDLRLLRDQVATALVTFLRAECAAHPVVLVLEDLHWGDVATVHLVDVVLRELEDSPLLVLALGRPEIQERFPRLWEGRSVQEIRLAGLNRRASERLVREMLGDRATEEMVTRLVGQARGHALFLEELIRAVADGQEELPETVLAMLQARFLRLETGARRVLRAASVFGETFWRGGVKEVLGSATEDVELDRCLEILIEAETIVRQETSRFVGEKQYAFRHALLREAAYGLLSAEGRQLGHRVAGSYLERAGERDALVLAEHHEHGGEYERAAIFLAQAAERALVSNDLEGVRRLVARGVACGARGELLGTLRAAEAWAELWQGNYSASYQAALGALEFLPAGSAGWVSVQGAAIALSGFQGQREHLVDHLGLFAATPPLSGAESAFMEPAMMALTFATILGLRDLETVFFERMRQVSEKLGAWDPRAHGMREFGAIFYEMLAGHLWSYRLAAQRGMDLFTTAGDRRWRCATQSHLGIALILLGEIEQGRALCQEALATLLQLGELVARHGTQTLFAFALAETGGAACSAEARQLAEEAEDDPLIPSFWGGMARIGLATLRADAGEWQAAEETARQAIKMLRMAPAAWPLGYAVLGRILLAQGRPGDAHVVVEDGFAQLTSQGSEGLLDAKLYLVAAEIQCALGHEEAARIAFGEAERRLAACAALIPEDEARQRFLAHSREHARLRDLASRPCSK